MSFIVDDELIFPDAANDDDELLEPPEASAEDIADAMMSKIPWLREMLER